MFSKRHATGSDGDERQIGPASVDEEQRYPLVNEQFDPGIHRGWKMSFH